MPIYAFRCPECGIPEEFYLTADKLKEAENVLHCQKCGVKLYRDYSSEGCHFQFGKENGSFKDKYSHSGTGHARSMPEMVEYFKKHEPEKMNPKKNVRDYKPEKIFSIPG